MVCLSGSAVMIVVGDRTWIESWGNREARRFRREQDPAYWRRKYFDLIALNAERDRRRAGWHGMAMVCALVAIVLLLLKWFFGDKHRGKLPSQPEAQFRTPALSENHDSNQ
jgi:hypothetical protein